jgi:anti-sigma factor ChrR (cupin superfamily)
MNEITFANWQDLSMQEIFSGICACELWNNQAGSKALVVKIDPGGKWQGFDVHEMSSEEIFVIEGIFNDGERDYHEGTFIHNPIGSKHIPQSETGCLLFVFYPNEVNGHN